MTSPMESAFGRMPHIKPSRQKAQIVYYLHQHGGLFDQPHLIECSLPPVLDGLRLKDFKNWLAVVRGKGMPDAFSWSYKRNYKGGYIWQDLSDDDLIQPLRKHEYVLMGSELQHLEPGVNICVSNGVHVESIGAGQKHEGKAKLRDLIAEGYMQLSPSNATPNKKLVVLADVLRDEPCPNLELSMRASLTGFSDCDTEPVTSVLVGNKSAVHVSTMSDIEDTSMMQKHRRTGDVKVYKAMEMEQTSDAATQTGESKRCSTEEYSRGNAYNPGDESLQHRLSSSLRAMTTHHHHQASRTPSLTSLPQADVNHHINSTFHVKASMLSDSQGRCHPEQDFCYSANSHSMSMAAISNKSEMFYSPSSVDSSCTVQETPSLGSARSLRSINSINSSRFRANPLQVVDDPYQGSINGLAHCGSNGGGSTLSKVRLCSSSYLLKQLLLCGSVDISESSTLNLRAMSVHDHFPLTGISSRYVYEEQGLHSSRSHGSLLPTNMDPQEGATSPRMTPKSWLCRPCGVRSSCFPPVLE